MKFETMPKETIALHKFKEVVVPLWKAYVASGSNHPEWGKIGLSITDAKIIYDYIVRLEAYIAGDFEDGEGCDFCHKYNKDKIVNELYEKFNGEVTKVTIGKIIDGMAELFSFAQQSAFWFYPEMHMYHNGVAHFLNQRGFKLMERTK